MEQQIEKSPQCVTTSSDDSHLMRLGQNMVARSPYKPLDQSLKMLKGDSKVLGALQILSGSLIFALGIFLGLLHYASDFPRKSFFITFYTGYPIWGAAFFIISGSICIVAEGKPTKNLVQGSFGMNVASATISLLGFIFLIIHFVVNGREVSHCLSPAPTVCTLTGFTSNGLLFLLLILTVLEFCITISLTILGSKANCCDSNEVIFSPSDPSVVVEISPAEQHPKGLEASIPANDTEILNK
ncbi:membrane-spanning 4-domains subfamily A member 3 [Sarcophilus harrisii]|uniref:Membrane spanning 4-domains A3 n=1 Tax=Sarcophilus harrisii TaxID=9305 RepID=A0A7N4P056_SARHA|nr:membrane-spanning 4-domains subfamily A member 3 [Sarcophilus harrisii]